MSNRVIRTRRGTTSSMSTLVGLPGEVFIDLTKATLTVHDGSQAGGWALAHEIHGHPNVTTLTAGFMSPDDKIKLDSLSSEGGIQNILVDTSPVTPRTTLNFSNDFDVVDDSIALRTDVALSDSFWAKVNTDILALVVALG